MSDIQRYDPEHAQMREEPDGWYVRWEDYQSLLTKLSSAERQQEFAVQKANDFAQAADDWQRRCRRAESRLHDCQQLLAQHEASAERRAYDDDVRDRISELESAGEAPCPKCAHLPSERRKACPHEDCPSGEYAR